jgi:membrane protein implicated in regulation of membrane protease activity
MTWLIMLLGLAGIILNIRKNRLCFVIWIPVNLALAAGSFQAHKPALGLLFCAYAVSSAWGWWEWRKKHG